MFCLSEPSRRPRRISFLLFRMGHRDPALVDDRSAKVFFRRGVDQIVVSEARLAVLMRCSDMSRDSLATPDAA